MTKSPLPGDSDDVTPVLNRAKAGDSEAAAIAWQLVMVDLQRLAGTITRGFQTDARHRAAGAGGERHDLASSDTVIHEAFLRIFDLRAPTKWESRRHFFGTMTRAMSQYLVDKARHDTALKRGGGRASVSLEFVPEELAVLDDGVELAYRGVFTVIDRLEEIRSAAAEVVRLRFIAGLDVKQTAEIMSISERTVSSHWNFARGFLRRELNRLDQPGSIRDDDSGDQ